MKFKRKRDFTWIIIVLAVIIGLIGAVFLTIWLWKVLPRWAFILLCVADIISWIITIKVLRK